MPVENVAAQFAPRVQSPMDVQNALAQGALAQNQLAQGRLQMMQAQNVAQQRNALSQALQSGQLDLTNPEHAAKAMALAPDIAPAIVKTVQEGQEKASKIALEKSQIPGHEADATNKALTAYRSVLTPDMTPDQYGQWAMALYKDPRTSGAVTAKYGPPETALANISAAAAEASKTPQGWQNYLASNATGMDNFIKNQTTIRGQDVTAQTSRANNADNIKKDYGVAGIQASTSRANNAATIAKDYKVAGIDPQTGNFVGGGDGTGGGLMELVGSGKMTLAAALARTPLGQKERWTQEFNQKYPDYDPTALNSKMATAKAFAPDGKSGMEVKSANTALNHISTLEALAAAQKNGDMQLFNKIANEAKAQFGGTAPTDLRAALTMVAPEVSKSVVGAGGTGEDRDRAFKALNPNYSPAQFLGATATIKDLLGGRLEENERAYKRGSGQGDFRTEKFLSGPAISVLSARTAPASTGSGGMPSADAIAAELKRRGH